MSTQLKAKLALFFAVILWSSAFVGIRFAVASYSPGALALLRYAVASLFLLLLCWQFKLLQRRSWRDILSAMGLGVIGFAIYNVSINHGERTVTAGIASFLIGLAPIVVAVIAHQFYRERLGRMALVGFGIGLVGLVLIMVSESQLEADLGVAWVLLAAVSGAVYTTFQKSLLQRFNSMEFTAWAIWGGTLVMLIYTPDVWREVQQASSLSTAVVVYMGIFPGVLAYFFWSYGFKHLSAAHAVSYSYWIPFFSTIFAFLFLKEIPHLIALLGGVIAIIGAILVSQSRIVRA
jgi:drug/metabolite transporter (DMT)-like permease